MMTQLKIQLEHMSSSLQNFAIVIHFHLIYLAEIKSFSGKANDIWALGVTLYALIYNVLPYNADTEM